MDTVSIRALSSSIKGGGGAKPCRFPHEHTPPAHPSPTYRCRIGGSAPCCAVDAHIAMNDLVAIVVPHYAYNFLAHANLQSCRHRRRTNTLHQSSTLRGTPRRRRQAQRGRRVRAPSTGALPLALLAHDHSRHARGASVHPPVLQPTGHPKRRISVAAVVVISRSTSRSSPRARARAS